jgi:DNA repair protein RecO (recombination protein O)
MPRPERSFRTHTLILRRRDFGEADRVLTVLTPIQGRMEVIAKGARKPVSAKTGHVELFTKADMLISRGRDLEIAAQAEVVEPYLPLREDLARGAYASYAAELVIRFTAEDDAGDDNQLFELVDATFARLCHDADPRLAIRYFEVRLLALAGFQPELNECVVAREPLLPQDQFFSFANGGAVSPSQLHHAGQYTPLPLATLKLLRHMQRSPYSQVRTLGLTPNQHQDLERVLLGYITYLLERRLQSLDFIRKIRALNDHAL